MGRFVESLAQEEKDEIKRLAAEVYLRSFGLAYDETSDEERYYVQKGIEAMAAIVFNEDKMEELRDASRWRRVHDRGHPGCRVPGDGSRARNRSCPFCTQGGTP